MDITQLICTQLLVLLMLSRASEGAPDLLDMQFAPLKSSGSPGQVGGSECWTGVTCKNPTRRPVCGTDGKTYVSKCELKRARKCDGSSVEFKSKGRCPVVKIVKSKICTPADRQVFNDNFLSILTEEFSRYHGTTRDRNTVEDGEIAAWKFSQLDHNTDGILEHKDVTTLKNMLKKAVKPRKCAKTFDSYCDLDSDNNMDRQEWFACLGLTMTTSKSSNKVCSSRDRTQFTQRLIQSFLVEHDERPDTQLSQSPDSSQDPLEARVISWKFSDLDQNSDGRLSRKEIRALKDLMKRSIRPKTCAKTFVPHCDLDGDLVLERHEWSACLGIAPGVGTDGLHGNLSPSGTGSLTSDSSDSLFDIINRGGQNSPGGGRSRDMEGGTDAPSILDQGCVEARRQFMGLHGANPGSPMFVPVCLASGEYRQQQCHNATGYCWCVDQTSGRPIPSTSTRNVMPDCSNVQVKEFKGCSNTQRTEFLTSVLDTLTQEMATFAENGGDLSHLNSEANIEQRAVTWKHTVLDTNSDLTLDKDELTDFKKAIRMKKHLRKCSRNFLRSCDSDQNSLLSLNEWTSCTGLSEQQRNLPPDQQGLNPFIVYLKG